MPNPWTPERRAAQAARIRALKPWEKSTGPRTKDGKQRASRNAVKHGGRRAAVRQMELALRHQLEFLDLMQAAFAGLDGAAAFEQARTNYKEKLGETASSSE